MTERDQYRRLERLGCALAFSACVAIVSVARAEPTGASGATGSPSVAASPLATASPSVATAPGLAQKLPDGGQLSLSSVDVPEGGVIAVRREFPDKTSPTAPSAKFEGTEIPFYPDGHAFVGLFGVPHGHKAGTAQVEVDLGGGAKQALSFQVHDGGFPHELLKVDGKLVNPPKKEMARIGKEQAEIGRIYRDATLEKYWDGPWVKPIDSAVTSPYGTRRLYNGEERNYHGGLDLKAAIGTPIHAAAAGKVVLAKNLYFTGNTVMIDHGYGLISLYAHMSKLEVKAKQTVKQGDLLGLSGKTGRVNGPHLHWQIILHKVKVNPVELLKVVGTTP